MSAAVPPVPEEFGSLIAQLVVADAAAAIDFYGCAFGAQEVFRQLDASGARVVHCELMVDAARFIVHDEFPDAGLLAPPTLSGSSVTLMLYVADADAAFHRALGAGARALSAPQDRFWGLRSGAIVDPFGHRWLLASRTEDLSPQDIAERARSAPPEERQPIGKRS